MRVALIGCGHFGLSVLASLPAVGAAAFHLFRATEPHDATGFETLRREQRNLQLDFHGDFVWQDARTSHPIPRDLGALALDSVDPGFAMATNAAFLAAGVPLVRCSAWGT